MQEGPLRDLITAAELQELADLEMTDLMAGKVAETADLFCHAAAAAKYGGHAGDIRTCNTERCVEARAILAEHNRRSRERRLLV